MILHLIRHGDCAPLGRWLAGRSPGVSLSESGERQALRLAEEFGGSPRIKAVFSSPLERAVRTAIPLCRRLGVDLRTREGFNELDFGEWTGRTFEDLESDMTWRQFNAFRSATRPPGGELMLEAQARALRELENLLREHQPNPEAEAVVVSHGDVIRSVVLHYLGAPLDHFLRISIQPASISSICVTEWGAEILCLNRTACS